MNSRSIFRLMIFTSAFCFVLVLSYTSASTESKTKADKIMEKISTVVVGELVQVANAAKRTKPSMLELNNDLLETTRNVLKQMDSEMKELRLLTGHSADQVAKDLALKINKNQALRNALPRDGKIAPRIIMPITDYTNPSLNRFARTFVLY